MFRGVNEGGKTLSLDLINGFIIACEGHSHIIYQSGGLTSFHWKDC